MTTFFSTIESSLFFTQTSSLYVSKLILNRICQTLPPPSRLLYILATSFTQLFNSNTLLFLSTSLSLSLRLCFQSCHVSRVRFEALKKNGSSSNDGEIIKQQQQQQRRRAFSSCGFRHTRRRLTLLRRLESLRRKPLRRIS